jgi:hypothetical protein
MEKTDDSKKDGVSFKMLYTVLMINVLILIFWAISYINESNFILSIFSNLPSVLADLATLDITIFGINIIRKGIFSKGGTKYYPKKIGEKKLRNVVNVYDNYDSYPNIIDEIEVLLSKKNNFDSEYFKYVYRLQKKDAEFSRVWNDYNFYSSKEILSIKEKKYFDKLEKYIFIKVVDESKTNS